MIFGEDFNLNVKRESCHKRLNVLHVASDTAKELYYYVQWTGHFICREDFYIDRRNFNSFLLLYTVKGSGTLHYENRVYKLGRGTTMLIDCIKPQRYYPDADGWEFKYVHFNGTQAMDYYKYITHLHSSVVMDGIEAGENMIDRIIETTQTHGPERICSDFIYRYLLGLIALAEGKSETHTDSFDVREALAFIAENYRSDIDVSAIAEMFHLSRSHFSVAFKEQTGFSPYNYILNYRLTAAKRMLQTTEHTVEYISYDCGFTSPSSFIRAFKRIVGMPPTEFRQTEI